MTKKMILDSMKVLSMIYRLEKIDKQTREIISSKVIKGDRNFIALVEEAISTPVSAGTEKCLVLLRETIKIEEDDFA